MVKAFAHGAMGRWIDHSRWTHLEKMVVVTKTVVCAYKRALTANQKEYPK